MNSCFPPFWAILRVTNLLNGAVDVINELQSQVDKNESDIGSLNGNLGAVGTRISSYPQKDITTTVGVIYDICSITVTEGTWLLIGYTLAIGNLLFDDPGKMYTSRKSSDDQNTNLCMALVKTPTNKDIVLKLVADYYSSTINADGNYCGIQAIRIS